VDDADDGKSLAQLKSQPRFKEDQRRRLAVRGKSIGRKTLLHFASIVTPDTLLA